MHQAVVFTFGGLVLWSQESNDLAGVPKNFLNEIVRALIEDTSVPDIKGYTAAVEQNMSLGLTAAVVYHKLSPPKGPQEIAADLCKLISSLAGEQIRANKVAGRPIAEHLSLERFSALATHRLSEQESLQIGHIQTFRVKEDEPISSSDAVADPALTSANVKTLKGEKAKRKQKKRMRRWDEASDGEEGSLDYSEAADPDAAVTNSPDQISLNNYGRHVKEGYVLNDLGAEMNKILGKSEKGSSDRNEPSTLLSLWRGLAGGKILDDASLDKALQSMQDHLVNKNVAKEVAEHICSRVHKDIIGTKTRSWQSVQATVRASVQKTLQQILTPNTSVNLLTDIQQRGAKKPYVISVVGVNGVGKSTSLSKIAFWLLQNNKRVLIAACDTFRSGAVEQLRIHVQRLKKMTEQMNEGEIELFEQGYGKDAAVTAQRSVEHGRKLGYDVVLIDTAGRRHNDERLMSSLEKFVKLANPDKIIMVGEALVGTDSVQQARNFNAAMGRRGIDFFLISKCDTVGNLLGTLVNMTYSTKVPVLFVGVGQNYTDLRTLSVDWAVKMLLS